MERDQAEIAETERFDAIYGMSDLPVIQAVTDAVCCCGHVGTSWTTRREADEILDRLDLGPTCNLLELGAGAGWPGLHLAKQSGCTVTLLDLPETGLRIARKRAKADGISSQVRTIVADASAPPFPPRSFSKINHADLLCCLLPKREVLEACRRVIRPAGRMTFSVIRIAPNLSQEDYQQAVENGPPFIEGEASYPQLLQETGWQINEQVDITQAYQEACERNVAAGLEHESELREFFGDDDYNIRRESWQSRLATTRKRLTVREFFVVTPV